MSSSSGKRPLKNLPLTDLQKILSDPTARHPDFSIMARFLKSTIITAKPSAEEMSLSIEQLI